MSELAKLMADLDLKENEATETDLKGVRFFKIVENAPRTPIIYEPGIYIVAQGHKIGYLGKESFVYDQDNYLVNLVSIPFECETFGSPEEPLLGIYIEINVENLRSIIEQLNLSSHYSKVNQSSLSRGIGPAFLDSEMKDAVCRLVKCLRSKSDTQILGPGLINEIVYRALNGDQAAVLYSLAMPNGNFEHISKVLRIIENKYAEKLDIGQLADMANMSESKFHKAFKEVTSESPLQYLKKLRLNKAKYLISQECIKAYVAAYRVGYESPSQFSREFKRYFGYGPAEAMNEH